MILRPAECKCLRFMKFFATSFLVLLSVLTALSQPPKQKAKPAPAKSQVSTTKAKPTAKKPQTTAVKAKKPADQPSQKPSTPTSNPTVKKQQATAAAKKPSEKDEWEKASGKAELSDRVAALRKFITAFPKSSRLADAQLLIATTETALGHEKLTAGDAPAAAALYWAAVTDAPAPLPEKLFDETFAKIPANLYFRGARTEAIETAKLMEQKAGTSAAQLLSIAEFYLSIENGSEAKRLAEKAIKLDANSSAAYQTLGLANRVDFLLDDSAAAYAKALELDPDSIAARRGLAEMKRSLGRSDEAAALYREIIAKDEANLPAQTGLILALFEAGKRSDAEAALATSLEVNAGNTMLLAGVAYWYAGHGDGDMAVSYAQKAIAADPRFIWSHIALARGYLIKNDAIAAEKTLLAARRYGNFPTLEYELASARLAAGFYREAGDELAKSFSVQNGVVTAKIGGRLLRESRNITELVGLERRASIFAPTAADSPENAARLTSLLALRQEIAAAEPNAENAAVAASEFVKGDDKMKVHRQIFAANQLLEKGVALPKVAEIARSAAANVDAGLDVPNPAVAVMGNELYESRSIAAVRGQYVNVPEVPRSTLSAILRGQVEELYGWSAFKLDNPTEAVTRLRRAVGVLPVDSVWWRSSTWRLATALEREGKNAEALEMYYKSYKSGGPNGFRYRMIESLYKRVNGSTEGLEAKIGPDPNPIVPTDLVAQKTEPSAEPTPAPSPVETSVETVLVTTPAPTPVKLEPTPEASVTATPSETTKPAESQTPVPSPEPTIAVSNSTPAPTVEPTPNIPAVVPIATPLATPFATVEPTGNPTPTIPAIVPIAKPSAPATTEPTPIETASPTPEDIKTPVVEMTLTPSPSPAVEAAESPVAAEPSPSATPTPVIPEPKPSATVANNTVGALKDLFPPVIITIPRPETPATVKEPSTKVEPTPAPSATPVTTPAPNEPVAQVEPSPTATPEPVASSTPAVASNDTEPAKDTRPRLIDIKPSVAPCTLTASEQTINIQTGGGDLAVIIGRDDDADLDGLVAVSSSPENVSIRREIIAGVKARALYVVRSVSAKTGVYQISFEMPCGKKDILVKVR